MKAASPRKALKLNGIMVRPRWNWSDRYRSEVQQDARRERARGGDWSSLRSPHFQGESLLSYAGTGAIASWAPKIVHYAAWLAARDGHDLTAARYAEWPASGATVYFYRGSLRERLGRAVGGSRILMPADPCDLVVQIEIPNLTWQPTVIEHVEPLTTVSAAPASDARARCAMTGTPAVTRSTYCSGTTTARADA